MAFVKTHRTNKVRAFNPLPDHRIAAHRAEVNRVRELQASVADAPEVAADLKEPVELPVRFPQPEIN